MEYINVQLDRWTKIFTTLLVEEDSSNNNQYINTLILHAELYNEKVKHYANQMHFIFKHLNNTPNEL